MDDKIIISIQSGTVNDDFFWNRQTLKITYEDDTYCFYKLHNETLEIRKMINIDTLDIKPIGEKLYNKKAYRD